MFGQESANCTRQIVFPNQGFTKNIARRKDCSVVEMNGFMIDFVVCGPLKQRCLESRDIRNGDYRILQGSLNQSGCQGSSGPRNTGVDSHGC